MARVGDLEIDQDMDHERRAWAVRKAAWIAIALLILGAMAGLLGSGPLSRSEAGRRGGPLFLEFQRFGRFTAPDELIVHLGPGAARGREARIWVSRPFLEEMEIESLVPEPDRVEAGPDRYVFVFPLVRPGAPSAFTFHLQAQTIGPLPGRVGLDGGPELSFQQFIYP